MNSFLDVNSSISNGNTEPNCKSPAAQVSKGASIPSRICTRKCSWEPSTSLVNQSPSQKKKRLKPGAAVDEVF